MPVYKGGKQYTAEDIQKLYEIKRFGSWDEMISYLEENGRDVLVEAKVGHIIYDMKKLQNKEVPFVYDPFDAFRLLQEKAMIHRFQES